MKDFNCQPTKIHTIFNKNIHQFDFESSGQNFDSKVIESFGEEWSKFNDFEDDEIERVGDEYFDILNPVLNAKSTYLIDLGCGTGRWSKYLAKRVKHIESLDPSEAIYSAASLLKNEKNVRLIQSSIDLIPFEDETFDIATSIGVLHHIPDTEKAMRSCIKKVKKGGYFYTYLYYNLEGKGRIFKSLFAAVNFLRLIISKMPSFMKKVTCDAIALIVYLPLAMLSKILYKLELPKIANSIPLNYYWNKSFFIMRNDSLDRFGTSLEQRFSKKEIINMMETCGLENIIISNNDPKYHAMGQRVS